MKCKSYGMRAARILPFRLYTIGTYVKHNVLLFEAAIIGSFFRFSAMCFHWLMVCYQAGTISYTSVSDTFSSWVLYSLLSKRSHSPMQGGEFIRTSSQNRFTFYRSLALRAVRIWGWPVVTHYQDGGSCYGDTFVDRVTKHCLQLKAVPQSSTTFPCISLILYPCTCVLN